MAVNRGRVRLTGQGWSEVGDPDARSDYYYRRGEVYEVDLDGVDEGGSYPLFRKDGVQQSYCWISPIGNFAAEWVVDEPASPPEAKPVRLIQDELVRIMAVLKKLGGLKPFMDGTELNLEGISMEYRVSDTVVGHFRYSYTWDAWTFDPTTTTDDQEN